MLFFSHPVNGLPLIPDVGEFGKVVNAAKESRIGKGGEGLSGLEKFANTDPLADGSLASNVDPLGVKPPPSESPKRLAYDPAKISDPQGSGTTEKLTEAELQKYSTEMIESVSKRPDAYAEQMVTKDPNYIGVAVKAYQEGPLDRKIAAIDKVYTAAKTAGKANAQGTTYKAIHLTEFLYWAKEPTVTKVTPELEQLRDLCDLYLQSLTTDADIDPSIKQLATTAYDAEPRGPNRDFPGFGSQNTKASILNKLNTASHTSNAPPKSNPTTTNIEDDLISRLPSDKKQLLEQVFKQQKEDQLKQSSKLKPSLAEEVTRKLQPSKATTSDFPSDFPGFKNPPSKLRSPEEAKELEALTKNPGKRLPRPEEFQAASSSQKPTAQLSQNTPTKLPTIPTQSELPTIPKKPETPPANDPLSRARKLPTPKDVNEPHVVNPTRFATQRFGRAEAGSSSGYPLRAPPSQAFLDKVANPNPSVSRALNAQRQVPKSSTGAGLSPGAIAKAQPLPQSRGP